MTDALLVFGMTLGGTVAVGFGEFVNLCEEVRCGNIVDRAVFKRLALQSPRCLLDPPAVERGRGELGGRGASGGSQLRITPASLQRS